jgi:hypothetical protein
MDSTQEQDPFLWDVETVIRNIGAPGHAWVRDASALASRLRDEEIDGKTLLTFEHVCSRQELMECLDIKPARLKAALSEAIHHHRHASPAYQRWLRNYRKEDPEDEATPVSHLVSTPPASAYNSTPRKNGLESRIDNPFLPSQDPMVGVTHHANNRNFGTIPIPATSQLLQPNGSAEVPQPAQSNPQLGESDSSSGPLRNAAPHVSSPPQTQNGFGNERQKLEKGSGGSPEAGLVRDRPSAGLVAWEWLRC